MVMIPVQCGRGGSVISSSRIAKVVAAVSLGAMLVMGGCSSKKTSGISDNNGAGGIGTNGVGGSESSLTKFGKGTLGSGENGPLSDIHFGYNEYTIEPQDGSVLKSNASWLESNA